MQDNNFKRYRKISLNQHSQFHYSKLYSLAPVGVGTSAVESLTSYISRLAYAHCVYPGILMEKVVQPAIGKKQSSAQIHNIYSFTSAINGTGVMATDVVKTLENLAYQDDLVFLTLVKFTNLFPSRNLLHKYKKWCPHCYKDWRRNFKPVYDPLIWKLKAVNVCDVHKIALQEFCPHCKKRNYHLSWKTRPGYCSQCHKWLGGLEDYDQNLFYQNRYESTNWDIWVVKNIRELIEKNQLDNTLWLKDILSKSLNLYARNKADGNIAALARKLQMPKNTVWMWCKNKSNPSLENLLHICYRLEISIWDFLVYEEPISSSRVEFIFPPPPSKAKTIRQILDLDKIKNHLQQELDKGVSFSCSMEQVARDLKIDKRTIYNHFPTLCNAISAKYRQHRKDLHQQFIEESCREVQKATKELYNQGIFPTENKVEKLLSRPGFLRYKKVKDAFADARSRLS